MDESASSNWNPRPIMRKGMDTDPETINYGDFPRERLDFAYQVILDKLPRVLKQVSEKARKKLGAPTPKTAPAEKPEAPAKPAKAPAKKKMAIPPPPPRLGNPGEVIPQTPADFSLSEAARSYREAPVPKEKHDTETSTAYNVLKDKSLDLAPGISPVERLFTTIDNWEDDGFFADVSDFDEGTGELVRATPKSPKRSKYFEWELFPEEGSKPEQLYVKRLPAWKAIEKQVWADRAQQGEKQP